MRSGSLNQRITIQGLSESQNDYGENIEQWYKIAKVWASVAPLSGRKYYDALQNNSELTTEIRIRYKGVVSTRMRILHGDDVYDIKSIINARSKGAEMVLMCKILL